MKAHTAVGRGEKSLLTDPGSELHLRREKAKEKCEDKRRRGQEQEKVKETANAFTHAVFNATLRGQLLLGYRLLL